MTGPWRERWERLLGFVLRRRVDRDLEAEFAAHMEMAVEDNIRGGMSPDEARRAAAVRFGTRLSAAEQAGDQRGLPALESFFSDVGYALRGMRKSPAFAAVVILTLALGIGANTALFSLVEAVTLRSLPVRDPGSLYFLVNAGAKGPNGAPPYECYERFRDNARSFEGMAAFAATSLNPLVDGRVEQVWGEYAAGSYFEVLGVRPAIGRLLTASDDRLEPPVAVISYAYWQSRFGGSADVLGKAITVDRTPLTIVGVTERRFAGLVPGRQSGITVPFTLQSPSSLRGATWFFEIVARLKPAVDPRQARAELEPIFRRYMESLPNLAPAMLHDYLDHMELLSAARGMGTLRGRFGEPLLILMVVVAVVLLVGCSNLANLFLARASSRQKEFAVRLAIGAGRWRLARQVLTETLLLFGCGAAAGLLFAVWGSRMLAGFLAVGRIPLIIEPELDGTVLAFTAGITVLTGLLFGLAPTLAATRTNPARLASSDRATDSPALARMRQIFVVAQVALSLALLVGGGLFVRTLANLNRQDLGFRQQGVLTMSVLPAGDGYTNARLDAFWAELLERVRRLPGVQTASVSILTPLSGRERGVRANVPGFQPGSGRDQIVSQNHVSDGYFETFGISLLRGRNLTASDREGAPQVVLINEAAAKFYFRNRDAIGATIELGSDAQRRVYEVAGIVRDAKHMSVRQQAPRVLYIPIGQRRERLTRLTLAVHTAGDPLRTIPMVQREVRAMGPDVLVTEVMTLQQQVEAALIQERLLSTVGGFFSFLALVLSAVGLYGLLSYVVRQRTGEIGVRMALGADRGDVVWMVLRRSLWLVAIGVAIGVPAALWAARPLSALLYGLEPGDPATVAIGVLVLAATAMLASYLPARRASRIDPARVLREG